MTGSAATPDQVDRARRGGRRRRAGRPRPPRTPHELVAGDAAADWDDAAGEHLASTSTTTFAPALGEAFGRADAEGRVLYGFVDHEVTTTYLGSTTGLRLRHVQPTGHYGCTGKTADLTNSAWVGGATRDFADVDAARDRRPSSRSGSAGASAGSTCRPAATTRSCRRPRWPT